MARKVEKEGTAHWQSITPARYIIKSHELAVKSTLQETKAVVLGAYFGGLTGDARTFHSGCPSGRLAVL